MSKFEEGLEECLYCGSSPHLNGPCPLTLKHDPVLNPKHYTTRLVKAPGEMIDVREAWELPFWLDHCVQYIARHRDKDNPLQDLKKARWYLDRYIAKLEREGQK